MTKDREERQTKKQIGWAVLDLLHTEIGFGIQFFFGKRIRRASFVLHNTIQQRALPMVLTLWQLESYFS